MTELQRYAENTLDTLMGRARRLVFIHRARDDVQQATQCLLDFIKPTNPTS